MPIDPNIDTIVLELPPTVTRWTQAVQFELDRIKSPLPKELILALIWVESRGVPGVVNPKSNASGLGQIMPIALKHYNQFNTPIDWAVMRQKDQSAAQAQIRVAIWLLSQFWVSMAKSKAILGTVGDLAKFADAAYCVGPKHVLDRIEKMPVPTWKNFFEKHSSWAPIKNHVIPVFKRFDVSKLDEIKIVDWLKSRSKTLLAKTEIISPGLVIFALIVIASQKFI